VSPLEAIDEGLADDGGLFVPVHLPKFEISKLLKVATESEYSALAASVLREFLKGSQIESQVAHLCDEAFNFPVPLNAISEDVGFLELFHGPTAAFKDFGARFLAQVFKARRQNAIVVVATSGDTGGAVAGAFDGQEGIDVIVLFPEKGVSPRQRH